MSEGKPLDAETIAAAQEAMRKAKEFVPKELPVACWLCPECLGTLEDYPGVCMICFTDLFPIVTFPGLTHSVSFWNSTQEGGDDD